MSVRAMPEWLTRRDERPEAWEVSVGAPARGQAWTNRVERKMRVPDGDDPLSRVIRAHEMMHAKVSPLLIDPTPFQLTDELIRGAEEYRVNLLIGEAGFDLDTLADGSEKQSGKYLAEHGNWNELVIAMAATAGTKSGSDLLAGVKSVDPDMHVALREVEKVITDHWASFVGRKRGATPSMRKSAAERVGSTSPCRTAAGPLPTGYVVFTIALAQKLEAFLTRDEDGEDGDKDAEANRPKAEDIKRVRNGQDKLLRFWPGKVADLPLTERVKGTLGKRRTAAPMGRNPRRIHRLLTDPQRRIFDHVTKGNGGIVVIDTSGSMQLTENDLQQLLEAAPGCVVISYGVRQRQADGDNIWILANRGKVVGELPTQDGLINGSDGPALRLGAKMRRGTEPFIWITDGGIHNGRYLTDTEEVSVNLFQECVGLIVKHGIHQIGTVAQAVEALKHPSGLKMKVSSPRFMRYLPR